MLYGQMWAPQQIFNWRVPFLSVMGWKSCGMHVAET